MRIFNSNMENRAKNNQELMAGIMIVFVSTLSNFCSLFTLYLIRRLGRWNAYVQIIVSMTICQFIYDVSFYLIISPEHSAFFVLEFLSSFGGTSVALWTNVMSGVVLYMVSTRRSIDVAKCYPYFFVACIIFPLILACLDLVAYFNGYEDISSNIYMVFRLLSIVFNIVACIIIVKNLHELGSSSAFASTRVPLKALSSRIKYYPVVQILSRVFPTFYELRYGFMRPSSSTFDTSSVTASACLILDGFFLPIAGIGYFIVFLSMQPSAYRLFKCIVTCAPTAETDEVIYSSLKQRNLRSASARSGGIESYEGSHEAPLLTSEDGHQEAYSDTISTFSGPNLQQLEHHRSLLYEDMDEVELSEEINMSSSEMSSSIVSGTTFKFIPTPSNQSHSVASKSRGSTTRTTSKGRSTGGI